MWIKICGIRDVATARAVAALSPDAIGLNFYNGSPRAVPVEIAAEIVSALSANVEPVGVFVNETAARVKEIANNCKLRTLQLHGDEPPELLAELFCANSRYRLIRAFRMGAAGLAPLGEYLESCRRLEVPLAACLIDAAVDGHYGGSGKTVPWNTVAVEYRRNDWPPLILAGGLNPANVVEAIAVVKPWGVDVASGVETSPGQKDVALVRQFILGGRAK
jgi:phosphoribosylanthranilate isomerase